MAKVKVFYDQKGNCLTVWFDNPRDEHVCEETGNEVVLMKNIEMSTESGEERQKASSLFERSRSLIAPTKQKSKGKSIHY
jgi:hypothetical protein